MPVNDKSLSNLKPGVKGEPSRNPNGRPPKMPDLKEAIARSLGKVNPDTLKTGLEEIIDAMRKKAAKGDVKAAAYLTNYGFGMPRQSIAVSVEAVAVDFKDAE